MDCRCLVPPKAGAGRSRVAGGIALILSAAFAPPRLPKDTCRDHVILDLRRDLILQLRCHGRPHRAADGCRDLNQAGCVCVRLTLEELEDGQADDAASPDRDRLLQARGVPGWYALWPCFLQLRMPRRIGRQDFSLPEFDRGRLGNYSGAGSDPEFLPPAVILISETLADRRQFLPRISVYPSAVRAAHPRGRAMAVHAGVDAADHLRQASSALPLPALLRQVVRLERCRS